MPQNVESIFLAAFFFPSAAAVLIFTMKYVSAAVQARARLAQDEAYRALASAATSAQQHTATALTGLASSVADLQARLMTVEKILRDVE